MNFNDAVKKYYANPSKENLKECVQGILSEMTVKEKIKMLSGHAMKATIVNFIKSGRIYNATPYGAGGCKRLGVPEVLFADGPRGCVLGNSTCFPVSMLRGAAFDDEMEYRVGSAIADECIAGGANYFAGICINLLRNPRWGRAQETYGEDQYLLGRMGAALTRAVQDKGMMACPKHYAMNSIEDLRFSVSANADDRTLREVYLPHFRKCVDAGALSMMGAYNKVNGTYCCENKVLLNDILRGEMGFDGFVSSDFMFGVYDAARSVKSGMDVEMPYTVRFRKLPKYLKKGTVKIEDIDLSVSNVLSALIRSVPNIKPIDKSVIVSAPHTALAREVAEKGIVLLENKGILPLVKAAKVAVVGRYADKINVGDKGSSRVYSPYVITPYQGIKEEFPETKVYNGSDTAKAIAATEGAEAVIVCVGSDNLQEGEFIINFGKRDVKPKGMGGDRENMLIPSEDKELITALYNAGRKLIVNVMGGSAYVIEDWKKMADAVIFSFYSGLEGGRALSAVLSGKVNPSGHLPFSIAEKEENYPEFLAMGDKRYEIEYGYYHGYALFDKKGIKPAYPFGYGLSYTQFSLSDIIVVKEEKGIKITFTLSNTGKREGATVVQVYAGGINETEDRPVKQLKGFNRIEVGKGNKVKGEISISLDDLKYYDDKDNKWILDKKYNIFVGMDSNNANGNKYEIEL
jgi:beta-glucosidase